MSDPAELSAQQSPELRFGISELAHLYIDRERLATIRISSTEPLGDEALNQETRLRLARDAISDTETERNETRAHELHQTAMSIGGFAVLGAIGIGGEILSNGDLFRAGASVATLISILGVSDSWKSRRDAKRNESPAILRPTKRLSVLRSFVSDISVKGAETTQAEEAQS